MKAIVYSTTWCPYCTEAKNYLLGKGVEVILKDIEADEANKQELLDKVGTYTGVPVIDINGQLLGGFNPMQIDLAIENSSAK